MVPMLDESLKEEEEKSPKYNKSYRGCYTLSDNQLDALIKNLTDKKKEMRKEFPDRDYWDLVRLMRVKKSRSYR